MRSDLLVPKWISKLFTQLIFNILYLIRCETIPTKWSSAVRVNFKDIYATDISKEQIYRTWSDAKWLQTILTKWSFGI